MLNRLGNGLWATAVAATMLASPSGFAATYQVSIDTSSLGATTVGAAFDLVDGGTPSNSVAISGFATDGALIGPVITTGSVNGSLFSTATLDDSVFFSEIYRAFTGSFAVAFNFDPTANGPDSGSLPDTFSFFLIDDQSGLPLFDTSDPTGAGALFTFEIDGSESGLLNVYSPTDTDVLVRWSVAPVTTSVPEPASLALIGAGLTAAWLARRKGPLAT